MIRVNKLSLIKTKKAKHSILLDDISLDIARDQITLFLGKSGSGKTSMLRCLSQIEKEYDGEILFEGRPIDQLSQKERCQLIGFVPQAYALFPFMSVLDNCAHPLRAVLGYSKVDAYKKVDELVSTLEMQNLLHFFPHELSGGQQQRAAILRALLLNPVFLLLDEPTSALDPDNTNLLIKIIRRLKKEGKGVIISSQDMYFAQKMSESVYFLEQGRVVQQHDFSLDPELSRESKLGRFLNPDERPEIVPFERPEFVQV
ncbi:MAG: amino acid ABC transporter ATP-binding protein [Chlamydiae bacterium CG10_big_fil_rev_8_21_14_0_10_42_34]|nr:MAG: amino acid ABC transporter ATP-binding protein [Chlamydiae bacterium CG10_big_fil_rev_8_21_14_0_10_42_34]